MAFKISILTQLHSEQAFELATKVFIAGSTLHMALDIGLNDYRKYLRRSFEAMIAEGLSVVAIDQDNEEVIGCLIVSDFHRHISPSFNGDCKFAPLAALTSELCAQYQSYRSINSGQAILVDMGAMSSNASGKGIYQQMRSFVQENAKQLGFKSVVGELSSSATQHVVLEKMGHKKIAEVFFKDFKYAGQKPFNSINNPLSIILAEGEL